MADSPSSPDERTDSAGGPPGHPNVTVLLERWQAGDEAALDRLMRVVDGQLRELASTALRREAPGHTLQTTALINEAYMRLVGRERSWEGSRHFMGVAAGAMRRVLVDHARRRKSAKRGGGRRAIGLDSLEPLLAADARAEELIELDEALERLFALHERPARAIELHYFGGLSYAEVAEMCDISTATVDRDLRFARAWLLKELGGGEGSA